MIPIAMKCSLEQFEDIKPILIKNRLTLECCDNFNNCPYLVNNSCNNFGYINNYYDCFKNEHNRTVFEYWNKDIFLEYCDIKPYKLLKR